MFYQNLIEPRRFKKISVDCREKNFFKRYSLDFKVQNLKLKPLVRGMGLAKSTRFEKKN